MRDSAPEPGWKTEHGGRSRSVSGDRPKYISFRVWGGGILRF